MLIILQCTVRVSTGTAQLAGSGVIKKRREENALFLFNVPF
jgi:hypothetical protein